MIRLNYHTYIKCWAHKEYIPCFPHEFLETLQKPITPTLALFEMPSTHPRSNYKNGY